MIETISTKLNTLFAWLQGTGKPLKAVFDYHTLENDWYPYLSFEIVSFTGKVYDTCTNEREYTYQVLIFQDITKSRKEAKKTIVKSIEMIISLLDANYTLDDIVTRVEPIGWTLQPMIINDWKAYVWEILLKVTTLETI